MQTLSATVKAPVIKTQTVQYTYKDLQAYFTASLKIAVEYGFLFIDIDEVRNVVAIGVETVDPPFYMGGGSCSPSATCRWSDAAFAIYGGPSTNDGKNTLPRITTPGGKAFDDTNMRKITGKTFNAVHGAVLEKIGVTTGFTRGTVSRTCTTSPMGGIGRWVKCQDYVKASPGFTNADGGDSGSLNTNNTNGTAQARGLVWALGSSNEYVFSNITNLEKDFGTLDFVY